jgi:hypothetical protein
LIKIIKASGLVQASEILEAVAFQTEPGSVADEIRSRLK